MAIVIELAPELESQIRQAAAQSGLSPDTYILESVQARLHAAPAPFTRAKRLPDAEADLLQKINQSLSQISWLRYRELLAKRQAETLTPTEQVELIAFSDQIEEANVQRMTYVAALAQLRKTTMPTLMKELGLQPV